MMATALLLCATLTLAAAPPANDGIKWTAEIDEALKLSQKYHVPVLLHFSSDHCPPCRLLEQRAFKSNDVIKAVHDDYIPVLVNVDQYRQIAQRYKVEAWPTDILLNSDGEVMHKGVSPQDPNQYVTMLKKGVETHRSHLSLKVEAAKTAAPTVIARSQVPQGQTPSANLQFQPFSLTGAQTTVNPSSVANRVAQSPSLQPQSETQTSSTSSANSASPIQTVNPFFQPPPAASASSDSTKTVTEVKAGTSESSIVAPTTDVVVAADPTTPSVEQPEQESVPPPVLDGFCPVTLHEALLSGDAAGAWVEGSPEFAVKHRSCIYWFKDEAQLQKFMDSPDKFAAVLSGYDLVSFLREGVLLPGKREHGYIRDGKLFLFSSEANKKQFAERHHEYVSELQQLLTHREAKKLNNPGTVTR
jgi:protein disulfide-isomerase